MKEQRPEPAVLPDGVEHGTPEGFAAGCGRDVTGCPAYWDHGMACFYAHLRAETDVRYFRAKVRDPRPAAIANRLGFIPAQSTKDAPKVLPANVDAHLVGYAARKEEREREALIAKAKPRREPIPSACPECVAGKHTNCDGTSWCQYTDQPTTCSCTHDPANTPTTQEHTMTKKTEPTSTPATKPKPPAGLGSGRSGQELAEIRFWARSNGHDVASHGRIPRAIIAAYDAAMSAGHVPTPPNDIEPEAPVLEADSQEPEVQLERTPDIDEEPVGEYDYAKASDKLDETRERIAEDAARPEWADVAISEDVERARNIAVQLENENARLTDQLATANGALGVALRYWDASGRHNAHLVNLTALAQAQLEEAVREMQRVERQRDFDRAHFIIERDLLCAEIDRLRARRWWQIGRNR